VESRDKSRVLRKLSLKLQYLGEENQEVQEDFDAGKWEISIAVFEAFSRAGMKIVTSNVNQGDPPEATDQDEQKDKDPEDPVCKKIFRKIAVKAHPDKLINSDEEERAFLEDLYLKAVVASRENDRSALIEIASSLDIELDIDPDLQIAALTEGISSLEKSIDTTKSMLPYIWSKNKNDQQSLSLILRSVISNMGTEIPEDIISDVLQWVSSGFPGGTSYGEAVEPPARRAPPPRAPGSRPDKIPKRRK
jgi:hypothetical protein